MRFRIKAGGPAARFTFDRTPKPQPPAPPFARTYGSMSDMSFITAPVDASRISVPMGTRMISERPLLPVQFFAAPSSPFSAVYFRL